MSSLHACTCTKARILPVFIAVFEDVVVLISIVPLYVLIVPSGVFILCGFG